MAVPFIAGAALVLSCTGSGTSEAYAWAGGSEGWRYLGQSSFAETRDVWIDTDGYRWCPGRSECSGSSIKGETADGYWMLMQTSPDAAGYSEEYLVSKSGTRYEWIRTRDSALDKSMMQSSGTCRKVAASGNLPVKSVPKSSSGYVSATPKNNPSSWFQVDNIDEDLKSRMPASLTLKYRLIVGTDGRVTGCTHDGTGNAAKQFGDETCRNITIRARFKSPVDDAGNPTFGEYESRLVWRSDS